MTTRLLSLLTSVERCLIDQGAQVLAKPAQRSVNYHKGLARLAFADGGAVSLQSFTLADGQICVKAALTWPQSDATVIHAIYPHDHGHDWEASADAIATVWMAGPASMIPTVAGASGLDRLVAVG